MRPVGFSTGALAKGDFRRALKMLKGKGCPAVELYALREPELEPLVEAAPSLELTGFEHVSAHAPSKILGSEHDIVAKLETLAALGWPVIVHPDVIQDFTAWRKLGRSVVIAPCVRVVVARWALRGEVTSRVALVCRDTRRRVLWELWETGRVFQAARWNRGAISKALWKT